MPGKHFSLLVGWQPDVPATWDLFFTAWKPIAAAFHTLKVDPDMHVASVWPARKASQSAPPGSTPLCPCFPGKNPLSPCFPLERLGSSP